MLVTRPLSLVTSRANARQFSVKSSELKNGVKVVSVQGSNTPLASLGLVVRQAGARGEKVSTAGSSHFLKRIGTKATSNYDKDTRALLFEEVGAELHSYSTRENLVYSVNVDQNEVSHVVGPLSQSLTPKIQEYIINDERDAVSLESASGDNFVNFLHQVAYRHQGLGNSIVAPNDQISKLDESLVKYHWARYFRLKNVTLVGLEVDHAALEGFAGTHIQALDWEPEHPNKSKYFGGEGLCVHNDHPRLALGFEAPNSGHKDRAVVAVLQGLLGGQLSAFRYCQKSGATLPSVNHSRLNQALTSEFAGATLSTHYFPYSDTGLFAVQVDYTEDSEGTGVVNAVLAELKAVASGKVSEAELAAARRAAVIQFSKYIENPSNLISFLGEQSSGVIVSPQDFAKRLSSVSVADLQRVTQALIQTAPTLVGQGSVATGLPTLDYIKTHLK